MIVTPSTYWQDHGVDIVYIQYCDAPILFAEEFNILITLKYFPNNSFHLSIKLVVFWYNLVFVVLEYL